VETEAGKTRVAKTKRERERRKRKKIRKEGEFQIL